MAADIIPLRMPNDLLAMEYRIAAGDDPDEIEGIERLWLFRFERLLPQIVEDERRFLEWLKNRPTPKSHDVPLRRGG